MVSKQVELFHFRVICLREVVYVVACSIPDDAGEPSSCEEVADQFGVPAYDCQTVRACVKQKVEPKVDSRRLITSSFKEFLRPLDVIEASEEGNLICTLDVAGEDHELDYGIERGPDTVHLQWVPKHRQTPLSPSLITSITDESELSINRVKPRLKFLDRPAQMVGEDERDQVQTERCQMVNPVKNKRVAEGPN